MLEALVTWILNNYLGKYVENLNTDQLSIALLSGQVELENLPLKRDALRHLGLPIDIEVGFIGKVILKIPVRQIRSAPWVLIIEQLYVISNPFSTQEWDAKLEKFAMQELKLSALDALEAQWRLETESKDNNSTYYASTYLSWLNYGTGFIADIIENLQLRIRDVHVRYEDSFSRSGKTVAFGITMESLSAQSCDSNWIPEFTHWDSSAASSFKLVDMQKLAIYCITFEQQAYYNSKAANISVLKAFLSQKTKKSDNNCCNEYDDYILAPVSAQAQLKHNRSEKPLRSVYTPRIVCDLRMEQVSLSLVDRQYEDIVKCINGLDDIGTLRKFRMYRPGYGVREDPKSWWYFAVCCNFIDNIPSFCKPKPSWSYCLKRARENVAYVKLYTEILTTPAMALSPNNKKLKDKVEWDRDYDELKILREISMRRVPMEQFNQTRRNGNGGKNVDGRGVLVRWFPNWMGWYSSSPAVENTSSTTLNTVPSQLEGEILEALSDSVANNTILKRDLVFGKCNFSLNSGTINLCATGDNGDSSSVPMMEFQFRNLSLKVTTCPRTSTHSLELNLGAIFLRDKVTESTLFPILVGPPGQIRITQTAQRSKHILPSVTKCSTSNVYQEANVDAECPEPLFSLLYEKKQSENEKSCDYTLSVMSKSLDVIYQPLAMKWLIEFMCHPHQTGFITHSSIAAMKSLTKKELLKNWEQILDGGKLNGRKNWELKLDISTPQIIFVENFTEQNSAVAIINFGRFQLRNNTNENVKYGNDSDRRKESEDDEMFMTPCSTPPVSEEENSETSQYSINRRQQQKEYNITVMVDDDDDDEDNDNIIDGDNILNERSLHEKLYEIYSVELTDLQILISKAKDNWRYAHNKSTSPLHVLDRFNISLKIERCMVQTCDPLYPSLTVRANLPKLIGHINEQKITAARTLLESISEITLSSPLNNFENFVDTDTHRPDDVDEEKKEEEEEEKEEEEESFSNVDTSKLLIFQFSIDQLALEVQSRGRSIAEVQVAGVRASLTKRLIDTSITLSVHSLLLVDALQTFGPDFELLVTSHKHIGMDSMSGSIRDSEPTSPTSPASPDLGNVPSSTTTTDGGLVINTSPMSITQALKAISPSSPSLSSIFLHSQQQQRSAVKVVSDSEALITIDITLIGGTEPMHIVNIQFNNLDIIANQETIVELMGFGHRAFPDISSKRVKLTTDNIDNIGTLRADTVHLNPTNAAPSSTVCNTEITFDFHRLNVLLLRGVVKDGRVLSKKIATTTMTEAKIQATVSNEIIVEGSLGGLQVVDLTPEGQLHQRIVSVGHDPLSETPHPMYILSQNTQEKERKAFSFEIRRRSSSSSSSGEQYSSDNDIARISVRMASVWYTHSPKFIEELQSCATEFKQYFANLARSLRAAATDMALGLVQSKTDVLAQTSFQMQSKSSNAPCSSHLDGTAATTSRKHYYSHHHRSSSIDPYGGAGWPFVKTFTTRRNTPYSPRDDDDFVLNVKLDVILDSPVVVLPKSSVSPEVFVAHLGKISIVNRMEQFLPTSTSIGSSDKTWNNVPTEHYHIEVRDMNIFSLDTSLRRTTMETATATTLASTSGMSKVDVLYACDSIAKPVLYDTILQLNIVREVNTTRNLQLKQRSYSNIVTNDDDDDDDEELLQYENNPDSSGIISNMIEENVQISGTFITPLKLSLTRPQYEQLLATLRFLTISFNSSSDKEEEIPRASSETASSLANICEEDDSGITTLKMDPHVKAKMFTVVNNILPKKQTTFQKAKKHDVSLKIVFELPLFVVELRGDLHTGEQQPLVDLSFKDFAFSYEKCHPYETNIQVSLRSITMEDLLQPKESKQRIMVISSDSEAPSNSSCASKSCPDVALFTYSPSIRTTSRGSLPDHLEPAKVLGVKMPPNKTGRIIEKERDMGRIDTDTPPPSPTINQNRRPQTNLVLVSSLLVDSNAPNFKTFYDSVERSTSIDFNCLDLVVNVQSWVIVVDFFSATTPSDNDDDDYDNNTFSRNDQDQNPRGINVNDESAMVENVNAETNLSIRSLNIVLVNTEDGGGGGGGVGDVAKANISHVEVSLKTDRVKKQVEGHLGSVSLCDLTLHGQLYKERFLTSGKQALHFNYTRFFPNDQQVTNDFDAQLKLEMSSVLYVHTKRFVAEIQAFFNRFTQLQAIMESIRTALPRREKNKNETKRLSIVLHAAAPAVFVPVSSKSSNLLIADLGQVIVTNSFKYLGNMDTETDNVSMLLNVDKKDSDGTEGKCLLEVMSIELLHVDLYTGIRTTGKKEGEETSSATASAVGLDRRNSSSETLFNLGSFIIKRNGLSLLQNKCHLKIQIERNLRSSCSNIPDMSIRGELSTLNVAVDKEQYKLIRGLLDYNLGENTEQILPSLPKRNLKKMNDYDVVSIIWTLLSIKFNLLNVIVYLHENREEEPIARINFIKSQLTVETFSNFSQDVDLVSQEIIVMDTRSSCVKNKKKNVFNNILQPIEYSSRQPEPADDTTTTTGHVQLEVHSRKRQGRKNKFTILLDNMRLMAIFDWWESMSNFIFDDYEKQDQSTSSQSKSSSSPHDHLTNLLHTNTNEKEQESFELKINITDSEMVVVQNPTQWDTNAVILKSTTVITYKSDDTTDHNRPLSMNLNNCEVYSCVLGMEDETALSIVDPVTFNMEINNNTLEVQLNQLNVHLSYRDMRMFVQILNSLPEQIFSTIKRAGVTNGDNNESNYDGIDKLVEIGFAIDDCAKALDVCNHKIDEAALWLCQNATPVTRTNEQLVSTSIVAIEIKAGCVIFSIIDDCGNVDVPLLEITLTKLEFEQSLRSLVGQGQSDRQSSKNGSLQCTLNGDYYNRLLSGWEPVLEPWKCRFVWENCMSSNLVHDRLQVTVESMEMLNLNVSSTFTELYQQVKNNWMQDIYLDSNKISSNYKSSSSSSTRSPFVPFSLKNDTGSPLRFTTMINKIMDTSLDRRESLQQQQQPIENWILVAPGETVPFAFKSREKMRHKDSHMLKLHQLCVKVEGWQPVEPVTVDKVGIYFRHAAPEEYTRTLKESPHHNARIVFNVALEGSAQKLVTVRSSLLIINTLKTDVEIRLENIPYNYSSDNYFWIANRTRTIKRKDTFAVPLTHVHSHLTVRPVFKKTMYSYCSPHISWKQVVTPGECFYELRSSSASKNNLFRFCVEIKRENYPSDKKMALTGIKGHYLQPGHTITLLPMLLISNLLPVDLSYDVCNENGRILPGADASLNSVDSDNAIEISVHLENFRVSSRLLIPTKCATPFNCRVKLEDALGRRLFLNATVIPNLDARIKVSLSAPYWIINKTGLPLVFKQGGVSTETAGQFEEHEVARMLTPLLFSLADLDASPTVAARVGNAVVANGNSNWCQNFNLRKGVQVRRLSVSMKDGSPDKVYLVGIQVRAGRGTYRSTTIVTLSPRFQLHNNTSYTLSFTQKCFKNSMDGGGSKKWNDNILTTVPGCHMSFHWPKLDHEQLLCVVIEDVPNCCFSGGLKIDANDSMHVNVRNSQGRIFFLRMEVVLEGATFFVIFTDADTMPPPIRVDNFSQVQITFWQSCCKDSTLRSSVRAHTSIPYAWDEPTEPSFLTVSAPGGITNNYDMNKIGNVPQLTYENFIYVAFTETFKKGEDVLYDCTDVENQQLVLDVVDGKNVILNRKVPGERSQLWRMTASGELQHEGSSPPSHPHQPRTKNVLVLDIDGPAPLPNTYNRLILRRPDPRRISTQTWRFTEDGRLCCAHSRMCVQAQDGFFGLRPGNGVVLGLPQPICHRTNERGIPLEQAICRQKLRPGSGVLSVDISTDGPTRVLIIRDIQEKSLDAGVVPDERERSKVVKKQRAKFKSPNNNDDEEEDENATNNIREFQLTVKIAGLGVSVVTRKPFEELLYAKFETIVYETVFSKQARTFCMSVRNVQIDNQLLDTSVPVILYVTPPKTNKIDDEYYKLPALDISAEIQPTPNKNAIIFKHLIINLKKLTINLEEMFILKLLNFIEIGSSEEETIPNSTNEDDNEMQKMLSEVSASYAKRYYFGIIHLLPNQIKLSMITASKLPPELKAVKRKLDIPFIKFEDALVDLEPFVRRHPFETAQFLISSIKKHFKYELFSQAGIILGSIDVLGNPVGFMNDVSEGVSVLFSEGSFGSLLKNVTHGLSNSAAKVTESISDGLGRVAMDEEHEEIRQRIRHRVTSDGQGGGGGGSSTGNHLVAGVKGLGFGILGGAISVFKHVYEGAANEGVQGVFSGLGKGLVGTVTKPVVGVLDLASETARAVRETSRSRVSPKRSRLPRCVWRTDGLLPIYSKKQSKAQQLLYLVNNRNYSEHLLVFECLRRGSEDLKIIVSNQKIWIVTGAMEITTVLEVLLCDIQQCQPKTVTENSENRYYIEITRKLNTTNMSGGSSVFYQEQEAVKRPMIRCDSYELAHWVSQQINYAKRLYDERLYTLAGDTLPTED